jgi:hypothetical protein
MTKIQNVFNARGRRLFESEKPAVDAFNVKYAHVSKAVAQPRTKPVVTRYTGILRKPDTGTTLATPAGEDSKPAQKMGPKSRALKRQQITAAQAAARAKA